MVKVGADAAGMSLINIFTLPELARLLKVAPGTLQEVAFNTPDIMRYTVASIPKHNGQTRTLRVPSHSLMRIQRRLLPFLNELFRPSTRAHGYIKGRGLRSNATPHIGKRYVLNIDLADFFETINFGRIRGRLMAAPYNLADAVATTIAKLCTCDETLPMGAATSPTLSNIICSGLDSRLAYLAKSHGCFYTRYADDLTFSSVRRSFPRALAELEIDNGVAATIPGKELTLIVEDEGLEINLRKSRLLTSNDRQEVCGVVCNQRLNVLPKLRREVRAALHAWRKFGLEEAEREWNEKHNYRNALSFENSLRGKIQFIRHIRGQGDAVVAKLAYQFNELRTNSRPIAYSVSEDWKSQLARTSCCIHSYMDDGADMVQGSGFVVDGGYIVTNHHVIAKAGKKFDKIELTLPGAIKLPIAVEVLSALPEKDLALLRPTDDLWQQALPQQGSVISEVDAQRDDVVWLSGWPNYNDGDDIHLIQGSVIGFSYPEGVKVFRISQSIVFGNSGGAVFNEHGEVIGIATRGSDLAGAPLNVHNGCVPASWIKDLLQGALPLTNAQ